jgi:hypothetical protein
MRESRTSGSGKELRPATDVVYLMSLNRWHLRATWAVPLAVCVPALTGADGNGCNGPSGHPAGDSRRADSPDSAPALLIGELLAQQFAGNPTEQYFIARFVTGPESDTGPYSSTGTCAGAAQTVGDCCYFPPSPLTASQPLGSGSPLVDQNAGVLTLVDTTSRAQIGTFNYVTDGYPEIEFTAAVWQPGDILTVRATGDEVGAFTVSAPALIPPIGQVPSSINLTQDFQITWEPDPNADIINISISDGRSVGKGVNCTLPDANGSVTVAASLFAAFQSGDATAVSLGRIAERDTQTSMGTVEFTTRAYSTTVHAAVQ